MHAPEAQQAHDALHHAHSADADADVHIGSSSSGKAGYCAMRGNCGRKSMFGAELPCPDDGKADEISPAISKLLKQVCGPAYEIPSHVCCTVDQVRALGDQLGQAAPLIASCPACINNFRTFYCDFTCSPDQAQFLKVTETQKTTTGKDAVKSIDYGVSSRFAEGFFDSCKSVQFGATNGFAMDLIGGGARNASAFLKYMGDERPGLGSPFQINFPFDAGDYKRKPLDCADLEDPNAHCACVDCPDVCPALPPPPTRGECTVGAVSCLTFSLLIIYSVAVVAGLVWVAARSLWSRRKASYERVSLDAPLSPTISGLDGLVGRGDDSESGPSGSVHFRLGRGASLLDPMEHMQPKQNAINAALRRFFYRLGLVCAKRPLATFAIWAVIIAALNVGWKDFSVETDPVRLWVSPSSEAAQQKEFFDKEFGPFFRSEQLFVSHQDGSSVMDRDTIQWWLDTEDQINKLNYQGSTLEKVCFSPGGDACVVQSISAWTGYELGNDWAKRIEQCAKHPAECLPDFGQPIDPKLILGGADGDWLNASALVVTYVVNNYAEGDKRLRTAEKWERGLESFINKLHVPDHIRLSYSTGVSLEEQLNKSTNTDVRIVVLSYLAMFLYVSLTLGRGIPPSVIDALIAHVVHRLQSAAHRIGLPVEAPNAATLPEFSLWSIPAAILINSKFSLGLFGIAIVLISVASSVGLFSLLGIKVTLIIAEVIPFLVLAVGVDNVFILVHELDRQNILHAPPPLDFSDDDDGLAERTSLPAEERAARAVAKMGPSILLSSTTEVAAFALGTLVPMPAVRNFAVYAAGSVLLAALMQVTIFVSAMTLDLKRAEAMRMDIVPCIRIRPPVGLYDDAPAAEDIVTRLVRVIYAPTLLKKHVKLLVVALFGGLFVASVIGIQHIQLGLDQRLALPADSYLVPYFNDVDRYLDVGPPVYFVVTDDNVADRTGQQELCGRFTTCRELSVVNTLEAERKRPGVSYLAAPPASWIDDFLQWTNPAFESCCRVRRSDPSVFCRARDSDRMCRPCFAGQEWDSTMAGLPEGTEVDRYLRQWLASPADDNCPLGGMQAYGSALSLSNQTEDPVYASHFRTFHTPLRTQNDFISALASARRIASELTQEGIKVFPYSLFYVFFDQYAYIIPMTFEVLSICLFAILCVTSLLLGSWRTGATVTFSCALTVVTVAGAMGYWGISLNAISLVNLVISLGIAVEFNSHLARAFMGAGGYDRTPSGKERDERVWAALSDVGASILCGITITKLNGIAILAFTTSKILEVYYFRMWLVLIIAGALHGLVLLPVLLSWTGGQGFAIEDTDEEWVTSQMHRPGEYEYAPFADDEDD